MSDAGVTSLYYRYTNYDYPSQDEFSYYFDFPLGSAGSALCREIWRDTRQQRLNEDRIRRATPLVRLWDAEWNCQIVLGCEYGAQFSWVSNDTGVGQVEIPFDTPAAQWIYDHQARLDSGQGRTVGITADYSGARWSGIMDKFAVDQREDGDLVLVVDFVHDYEHL